MQRDLFERERLILMKRNYSQKNYAAYQKVTAFKILSTRWVLIVLKK